MGKKRKREGRGPRRVQERKKKEKESLGHYPGMLKRRERAPIGGGGGGRKRRKDEGGDLSCHLVQKKKGGSAHDLDAEKAASRFGAKRGEEKKGERFSICPTSPKEKEGRAVLLDGEKKKAAPSVWLGSTLRDL